MYIRGKCSAFGRNTLVVGKLTLQSGQAEPAKTLEEHSARMQKSAK
jgi:hypothetical protein